jgi:hypothetical protein
MIRKDFVKHLQHLVQKQIANRTGSNSYLVKKVTEFEIVFVREGKGKSESISIDELFEFYKEISKDKRKTTNARDYISGRMQSPAVAILDTLDN